MSNPFAEYAEQNKPAWKKRKEAAAEKRKLSYHQQKAVNKALADRDLLFRLWKKWRKELTSTALEGPYEEHITNLINFLRSLASDSEHTIVAFVAEGPWLEAPEDIRQLALELIDARLTQLREEQDLPPFNDSLFDEPPTVFELIRNKFRKQGKRDAPSNTRKTQSDYPGNV